MKQVTTPGEALSVLIQVAELAQAKGILTFEDAVVTKSAIDFFNNMSKEANSSNQVQPEVIEEGPVA
jgi:hypothetical protein